MTNSSTYQGLIEAIIRKQSSVVGMAVAVRRARNVSGIEVDDAGKVTAVHGNEQKTVEDLVDQYKMLSGSIGLDFCRQAAAAFVKENGALQLPSSLA